MEIVPIRGRSRLRLGHLVEALRIDAAVTPELAGPALLDRIGDLNRARLLPLIARVFDDYDRPGTLLRIDRLDLDLGRFESADLDGIEGRLEAALRAALADALAAAPGPERLPLGRFLVGTFEHYLLHGVWPYGAALDPATKPADCLALLTADEPDALVAMLRRRGAADPLLRRLVRQMPEARLQALLHRLAPAHAAHVIAYLDEVRASHRIEPVVPVTPAILDETLWTIVLRDALAEAGLQANRKAFLRRLLGQLAAAHGVAVGTLMLQLRRGARRARPWRQEPGSLAALVVELVSEDVGMLPEPLLIAELAGLLGRGPALTAGRARELRQLFALGRRRHPVALRWLLRRLALADAAGLAQRIDGALPLQDALEVLLGGEAPAAGQKLTGAERAALLRRAALAAPDAGPAAALADLLDGGDATALAAALARARETDPIALRRLLRVFALADAGRLRERLGMKAPALAALLLPDHLAAALAALAEAASATPDEWDALLEAAGAASESALVRSLERRAWDALGRPGTPAGEPADLLAARYAALDQAAVLWDKRAPFSPAERAAALGLLLPRLSGVPAAALRARLRAAGAMPDLAALTTSQWRRLALLLAPAGEARRRLRAAGPGGMAALVRALVEGTELPARAAAPIAFEGRAALAAALRRLSPAALDRLIGALGGVAPRRGRPRWQVALELATRTQAAPWNPAGTGEVALGLLRARLDEPGRAAGALRALIAALGAGVEPFAAETSARREAVALAAMLRARPLAAVRLVAGSAPETLGAALPALLAEPGAAASLFAALAPAERARAMLVGRLLTGRSGRAAIAPWKVARALARAAGAREWRSGAEGFAALWLGELMALATPAERPALERLVGEPPAPAPAEPPGEGELVRALAKAAPAGAGELLHAAERIAAATGADRPDMWQALLAAAARDAGDVAPLARLLLDGRSGAEAQLRRSLKGARDGPLRAALETRARERPPARKAEEKRPSREAADPGAILVANAGLVLLSAYLPRLFQRLDFLAPDPSGRMEWRSLALRERAVHLLQWLADARCDAPEPQLALNKLLCGMHPSEPVAPAIDPTEAELAECRALLAAVIANWPVLGSTSIEALRETFLQREGSLKRAENGWSLEVERKVLDILIDQLPWGFATILHPWMRELVTVDWG
ncbi:MAG: hypothetical protein QOH47_547 [Sphingomonadales bacterium]|nr:hypothetical protein [Sphingomonadales bacterium]